jgi:hypothetical protein
LQYSMHNHTGREFRQNGPDTGDAAVRAD